MLTKIEMAKAQIALNADFWIPLTAKLEWIPEKVGTACTDGRTVRYDPEFMEKLTLPEAIGLVLHETGHNLLSHPSRFGGRDPYLAGVAMDIVLNQMLQEYFAETPSLRAELPKGGVYGPMFDKYKGWNYEKVYGDLYEMSQQAKSKLPQLQDIVEPGTANGKAMTPEELEELSREWTMAAQQAAAQAKKRGKMPGCLAELVADMVKPRVNWKAQLPEEFRRISKEEQSWRRLNRRFLHEETYLPGMYSEQIHRIVFAVDTSGSMDNKEFAAAMGAMNEILMDVKPEEVYFIQCDTRVVHEEILTPDDLPVVAKEFKGRGGTTLTPIFENIRGHDVEPELVVVLTDGEHEAIDKRWEPPCRTIWLVTTDSTQAAMDSFGGIIRVEV